MPVSDLAQTNRMQFLSVLDRLLESGYTDAVWLGDQIVSVKILCRRLWDDETAYINQFDSYMRDVCGHEFVVWKRVGGTWGAAARAAAYFIEHALIGGHGRPVRPQGMWVSHALQMKRPSAEWSCEAVGRGQDNA